MNAFLPRGFMHSSNLWSTIGQPAVGASRRGPPVKEQLRLFLNTRYNNFRAEKAKAICRCLAQVSGLMAISRSPQTGRDGALADGLTLFWVRPRRRRKCVCWRQKVSTIRNKSLPEKCLRVGILLLRKNGYYEKHFGKKFLIVETNGYYWKRGK